MSRPSDITVHGWTGVHSFAITLAVTLALVAAINVAVDPYGYFGTPVVSGVTALKPSAFTHDRFLKAGLASRSLADCLLAGNSRIGEGIPGNHPVFAHCRQVLDISLAGPNVAEIRESVGMAARRQPDAELVVNIDFFSFNALRERTRGGNEFTFAVDPLSRMKTIISATLSMDVTLNSLTTLGSQNTKAFYASTGEVNQDYLQEATLVRPTRATFLRGLRGYIFHMLPPPTYDFKVESGGSAPHEDLRNFFLDRQASHGKTIVFISAPHAWQLELIDALGLGKEWIEWKRAVVQLNEEVAQKSGRPPLPLWDFSGYSTYATEPVPPTFDINGPLANYWDNSHFRHSLGARILDRMFYRPQADTSFGVKLTSANVEDVIARTLRDRARWREGHAQDLTDIHNVVSCFAPPEVLQRLRITKADAQTCSQLSAVTR